MVDGVRIKLTINLDGLGLTGSKFSHDSWSWIEANSLDGFGLTESKFSAAR